uniref:Uncharacterized protein n=1 Tax=Rhipicephalus appendiculatus TaxID=34631 RepID=A0A131YGB5_RHIAP
MYMNKFSCLNERYLMDLVLWLVYQIILTPFAKRRLRALTDVFTPPFKAHICYVNLRTLHSSCSNVFIFFNTCIMSPHCAHARFLYCASTSRFMHIFLRCVRFCQNACSCFSMCLFCSFLL